MPLISNSPFKHTVDENNIGAPDTQNDFWLFFQYYDWNMGLFNYIAPNQPTEISKVIAL